MELGQIYRVKPVFVTGTNESGQAVKGRVVYIHPQRRWAALAFDGRDGTVRECFWPDELTEENRCRR